MKFFFFFFIFESRLTAGESCSVFQMEEFMVYLSSKLISVCVQKMMPIQSLHTLAHVISFIIISDASPFHFSFLL